MQSLYSSNPVMVSPVKEPAACASPQSNSACSPPTKAQPYCQATLWDRNLSPKPAKNSTLCTHTLNLSLTCRGFKFSIPTSLSFLGRLKWQCKFLFKDVESSPESAI